MDEFELIESSKQGNRSSMGTLLQKNYKIVAGYVMKLTGNSDIAQDIIQDTMLKAVLNINKYTHSGKFSTWLITIATNTYRDYLRKNKRLTVLDEDLLDGSNNPEEITISKLEYEDILSILSSLPYEKRAVFILKHYYGYKYEDIAEILKCPIGTVRSRLHNSIKIIMSEFEKRRLHHE